MSSLLLRPISYRHVIFPDRATAQRPALNFSTFDLCSAPTAPEDPLSPHELDCLRDLFQQGGLDIADYRFETIKRRIPSCIRALRLDSLAAVRSAVENHPELLEVALGALIIGVTAFFRDSAVFDAIAQIVIPNLLSRQTGPRIWSIGCSDGPELYSVSILLAERGALQRSTLLGTDCRPNALARARKGCYDSLSVKNVPADLLSRYFQTDGSTWQTHPYLRATTQWRSGNALTTPEPGVWDLILCRNMSIYLQPASATRLWQDLEKCLRPGGFLVLGKAERPQGTTRLIPVSPCIFRRNRSSV